jgi:tetratricopeptide (TPR) repeat protein
MQTELTDEIHARIKSLCADGDLWAERKDYESALKKYLEASELLPEPILAWEAATWIFAAVGDAHFHSGNIKEAYNAFSKATHCPGGIGNPFLHLRLGEIQFELGNELVAADELTRAYMAGGSNIFKGEPDKYFDFIKLRLKMPAGGW